MNTIIEEEGLTGTFAYLDDVTVCGMTQEEHNENLHKFLSAAKRRLFFFFFFFFFFFYIINRFAPVGFIEAQMDLPRPLFG